MENIWKLGRMMEKHLAIHIFLNTILTTGILIEPQKDKFNELKINRSRNKLFNCAVSNLDDKNIEFIGNNLEGYLTIYQQIFINSMIGLLLLLKIEK